jgi:hypothetical protein
MMDSTDLVHQIMTALTPVMPYVSSVGTAIATKVGEDTYQLGKKLYDAIRARFAQEPDDKATRALQAWVDDPDLASTVEVKLSHLVQRDAAFARMLLQLIQTGPQMVIEASDEATARKNVLQNTQRHGSQRITASGKSLVEENQMIIKNE